MCRIGLFRTACSPWAWTSRTTGQVSHAVHYPLPFADRCKSFLMHMLLRNFCGIKFVIKNWVMSSVFFSRFCRAYSATGHCSRVMYKLRTRLQNQRHTVLAVHFFTYRGIYFHSCVHRNEVSPCRTAKRHFRSRMGLVLVVLCSTHECGHVLSLLRSLLFPSAGDFNFCRCRSGCPWHATYVNKIWFSFFN